MIPLFVDCSGRRILIFGGGDVAARKYAYFSGKADVTVVSRSFSSPVSPMLACRNELDTRSVSDEVLSAMLDGAFLVIAALSDPEENNRIGRICAEKKILFNNADGETGDVILPSVTRGKNYTLAISTGGSSPAISRFIREHIEQDYPALDAMIGLQQHLRDMLKETEPDQKKRSAILHAVLDDPAVWEMLKEDPERAVKDVIARYIHG
ncbi:bifunctional precorrin-2 dehydrogenase/sirohydrochlorin ferrochelatase [uncultured Methanoregula sp.]|uniref:precorrin-2 dehydrogenase/sirohydrochlorin ferrochelatase family protein n=1 Tax=uncultured Methanoregula sp. TaxID=1005933 RepID=UPI002AAC12AD|nr:bifunctional precorrin-2 dehydrogenase/sirohydrochlorin ferrochelatase [uncultured Methanoregula sp.]